MVKPINKVRISDRCPSYNEYLFIEWNGFKQDSARWSSTLGATSGIDVKRVLDIGCGAGQEMLPFVAEGAMGVGLDLLPEVGQVGRPLFEQDGYGKQVSFVRGSGSDLPFEDGMFDVVICRVALSYMDNRSALHEMARVLRPGGKILLKYAAPSYYWYKVREGIANASLKTSIYAARVLCAGYVYKITGRQPFGRLTAGGEIFQTESTLAREIEPLGLFLSGHLPDSNDQTPSVVITKTAAATASLVSN